MRCGRVHEGIDGNLVLPEPFRMQQIWRYVKEENSTYAIPEHQMHVLFSSKEGVTFSLSCAISGFLVHPSAGACCASTDVILTKVI